jgi:hypothetical protein
VELLLSGESTMLWNIASVLRNVVFWLLYSSCFRFTL